MQVTKFATTQFGGVKGVDLQFGQGLNVILGPNESGKSTIINAMSSAMFRPASLDKRSTGTRDFLAQFLPHPDGTFCDSSINIDTGLGIYSLHRKWGTGAATVLVLPDGTRVEGEERIEQILDALFVLGRRTYERVVFARQKELKGVLETLRDDQIIDSIGSLLRKAVMQLDGISLDKLEAALDREYRELMSRWDSEGNGPEGNRSLSNPWKSGVGTVLKAWYQKEALRQEIYQTEKLERELSTIRAELSILQTERKQTEAQVLELAQMEGDVFRRAGLEPGFKDLQKQAHGLKSVVQAWPQKSKELHELQARLVELAEAKKELDRELDTHGTFARKLELEKLAGQVQDRGQRIADLQSQLRELPPITVEIAQEMANLSQEIITAQAAIQAGTLLASINLTIPVHVTRDLEGETLLEDNETQASGYLKLRLGDIGQVEIRAGQQDFVGIKHKHQVAKSRQTEILALCKLDSPEEIKTIRIQIEQLTRDLENMKEGLVGLLGGKTQEEIVQELTSLEDTVKPRDKVTIQRQKDQLEKDILVMSTDVNIIINTLGQWTQEHGDSDRAMDLLADCMGDLKQAQRELESLQPLPEQFSTAQYFSDHLRALRQNMEQTMQQLNQGQQQLFALEREMSQFSLAEMQDSYRYLTRDFENLLQRGQKLGQIQLAFSETVAEMDSNSFQPLALSFSKYLSRITQGSYKLGNVDDKLNLDLVNRQDRSIPVGLLSSGTYDCTALSLRFALLEHVFGQEGGMVVLDDCLVDMDPERKEEAIAIIQEYAAGNQVIFTTCNPDTARELGGKLMDLGKELLLG